MPNGDRSSPRYPIDSVDNVLRLLVQLREPGVLRVADVSRSLGVARGTAHRLLVMLQHHGFVTQDPVTRAYAAGPLLVEIGLQAVRGMGLRQRARRVLEWLRECSGETVHLVMLRDRHAFFVDSLESHSVVRAADMAGTTVPAHWATAGRAMLAGLDRQALRVLYPERRLDPPPGDAPISRAAFERDLDEIRRVGYAWRIGGAASGDIDLATVAAAIERDGTGTSAAIVIAAPAARAVEDWVERLGPLVVEAARKVGP